MRLSKLRTSLAVLRDTTGQRQKEFAEMIGKTRHTVQAIESGKHLTMPPALAERICRETGIALAWLLNNDVSKPPVTPNGTRFTKAIYEAHRASIENEKTRPREIGDVAAAQMFIGMLFQKILDASLHAMKNRRHPLYVWKIGRVIDEIAEEFGVSKKPFWAVMMNGFDGTGFDLSPMLKAYNRELQAIVDADKKTQKVKRLST